MNAHTETRRFRRIRESVLTAPSALLAYTVFAITVTFADFILLPFASESLHARLVPYTGWVASGSYTFTIFFAFALIFQQQRRSTIRLLGITLQLLIQIGYGAYQLSQMGRENFGNPYLTINRWQPIWTILIPVIWLTVLHSPRMNRFCRQSSEPNVA
jgi:hypothetical protein